MFSDYVELGIRRFASERQLCEASTLALADAVGDGVALVAIDGRLAPPISYAHHVFHRRLRPGMRAAAIGAGYATARPDPAAQPLSQRDRHRLLDGARMLDAEAACAACAWGVGRAPGELARALGYDSAEALAAEATSGLDGQLRLMMRRLAALDLDAAFAARDWRALAEGLADAESPPEVLESRLARADARWSSRIPPADADPVLALGSTGHPVVRLHALLQAAGVAAPQDGTFGAATLSAVRAFQLDAGLVRDGVVGEQTWRSLRVACRQREEAVAAA